MENDMIQKLVDAVKAASTNPRYILYVPEWFVKEKEEYFYERYGILWFDHPSLLRVQAIKIPNSLNKDSIKCAYIAKKFDQEIWRCFNEL